MDLSKYDEVTANEIIRDTLASMHFKQMAKHSVNIETIEVDGYTGYLAVDSGGAGDESFLEELPKCDKPDLGYEIGSEEWHAYWDGYTYGQYYYATAQHLNLSVEEAHYFADYPDDYVIGSYATLTITGLGTAEVKGEY